MNMKISKRAKSKVEATKNTKSEYSESVRYIKAAIESLGDTAKSGDVLARESIANLSVVLFDLK